MTVSAVQQQRTDPDPPDLPTAAAGAFRAITPERILDTRIGLGAEGPIQANGMFTLQVTGRAGVPLGGVPGTVQIRNGSAGTVEVIADVTGYYLAGAATRSGTFAPVPPARVLDTRSSLGVVGPVAPQSEISVQIAGQGGVPPEGAAAVALNVTVTGSTDAGYIQAYPGGTPPPTGSSLNFVAGQTVPNLVVVPIGADGTITLNNGSPGTVQLIGDVYGYVLS